MAQGNALSVFARAVQIKRDPRYIRAGELAFATFMTPVDKGGALTSMADLDPSLSGYVFFPEYPNKPIDYTLNGYMFALLGVYDWSHVQSTYQNQAKVLFRAGMKTLELILPYYDVAGFSTYDLAHLVLDLPPYVTPDYLGIHVYLLHALNSVAPNNILAGYKQKWAAKIDAMNKLLKFTIIKTDFQSPQPVGKVITIKLDSEGGDGTPKLYKYVLKHKGEWATLATYSEANSFIWTPREPGEYILGFFVKNKGSKKEWDNFRHQTFVVQ